MRGVFLRVFLCLLITLNCHFVFASENEKKENCELALVKTAVSTDWVSEMQKHSNEISPQLSRLQDAVQRMGFKNVAFNRKVLLQHNPKYTFELPMGPITNQEQSGRCWIFAGLNMFRSELMAQGKVKSDFEFSENYLHFFNMLEKSNRYLEKSFEFLASSKPTSYKQMKEVLSPNSTLGDGGWFNYFQYLVAKYGVVPKGAMPETRSSSATETLRYDLQHYIGTKVGILARSVHHMHAIGRLKNPVETNQYLQGKKKEILEGVWKILVTHLGVPPQQIQIQTRESKNIKNLKGASETTIKLETHTPLEYMTNVLQLNPKSYVVVSNYLKPNMHFQTAYIAAKTVIGEDPNNETQMPRLILNMPIERLIELTEKSLLKGTPVWFAADIHRDVEGSTGIMHPHLFDKDSIYDFKYPQTYRALNKDFANFIGLSVPNHAMLITGFDRPDPNGPIVKFKNENSWGPAHGTNGIYHLYTQWFEKHVYEVVVPKSVLSEQELAALDKPVAFTEDEDE